VSNGFPLEKLRWGGLQKTGEQVGMAGNDPSIKKKKKQAASVREGRTARCARAAQKATGQDRRA